MSSYSFFFHYNKPASQKKQKPVISLHFKKSCYFVDNVIVKVPISGRIGKRQPKFVMAGKANEIQIKNSIAYIN